MYDEMLVDHENVRIFARGKAKVEEHAPLPPNTLIMNAAQCLIRVQNGRVNMFANHPEVRVKVSGGYQWLICDKCGASVVTN